MAKKVPVPFLPDIGFMRIVQLMASPFYGGPERQMLGLACSLPAAYRTVFLTFAEGGKCQALLEQVQAHGLEGFALEHNFPDVRRAVSEVVRRLRGLRADVLCCSGYKPDVIGWLAARQARLPIVAVAHGWTAATLRVRLYEALDRLLLRWFDAVVCVSQAQAQRMRRAWVPGRLIQVIRNAVGPEAFTAPDPAYRERLYSLFADRPRRLVGGAGRLSPEKGFERLVEAAALVVRQQPEVGFVVFGAGPLRQKLERRLAELGLQQRFLLAGFRSDLAHYLPHFDLAVLPSYTEGLPVVLLEFLAAGVPAVATAVGGTPEVIEEGQSGYLVPAGDASALARRILDLLHDEPLRQAMGQRGQQRVRAEFTLAAQSAAYQHLFEEVKSKK